MAGLVPAIHVFDCANARRHRCKPLDLDHARSHITKIESLSPPPARAARRGGVGAGRNDRPAASRNRLKPLTAGRSGAKLE
jgi:hypothetical protein